MKQAITLFILVVFLAQTFSRYVTLADYYTNTAEYARNCENKDKPWMHCNGHCQLSKKLKQQDTNDKQLPEKKSGKVNNTVISSRSFFTTVSLKDLLVVGIQYAPHPIGKAVKMPQPFFHPPDKSMI